MANELTARLARWRSDPVAFISEALIDPATSRPFKLYHEQVMFLREAFRVNADGRMLHTELVFSGGKKSGKTGLAAMIAIYTAVVLAGVNGEIYCVKAAQKVHQWPQGKYISLRVGGNGGLASGRGSARGISASPLH
jgi:hypothetical protein